MDARVPGSFHRRNACLCVLALQGLSVCPVALPVLPRACVSGQGWGGAVPLLSVPLRDAGEARIIRAPPTMEAPADGSVALLGGV